MATASGVGNTPLVSSSPSDSATRFVHLNEDEQNRCLLQSFSPNTGSRRTWYTTSLLFLVTCFLYMDQNLMGPNLTQIATDFGMDAQERDWKLGGQIGIGFFLLGAPAALWIGYLTDKCDRRKLFTAVVVLGELPALLTWFVTEYWQLFVLRTLTGVSMGGAVPLTLSLISDLFPSTQRSAASGAWGLVTGLGIVIGQALSGTLGPRFGWRLPFVVVSLPAMALALLLLTTTEDPPRGGAEDAVARSAGHSDDGGGASGGGGGGGGYTHAPPSLREVRGIFRRRTNVLAMLQGIPGCVPWGVLGAFFADYLAQDEGLGVGVATLLLSLFGLGNMAGGVLGGLLGQRVYNWRPATLPLLMGGSVWLGIPPMLYLVNADAQAVSMPLLCAVAVLTGVVVVVPGANVRATVLNVNTPETRGSAVAFFTLTDDIGRGLSPMMVALLVSWAGSRRAAFNWAIVVGWGLCGACFLLMTFTVVRDVVAVERAVEANVAAATAASAAASPITSASIAVALHRSVSSEEGDIGVEMT